MLGFCLLRHTVSTIFHLSWFLVAFLRLLKFIYLLPEGMDDASIIMMASSICSLILDLTSEEALLNHPDFISGDVGNLSKLIRRSFVMCGQVITGLCFSCFVVAWIDWLLFHSLGLLISNFIIRSCAPSPSPI